MHGLPLQQTVCEIECAVPAILLLESQPHTCAQVTSAVSASQIDSFIELSLAEQI